MALFCFDGAKEEPRTATNLIVRTARELPHEADLPEERPDESETANRAAPKDMQPIPAGANATIQNAIDRLYQKLKGFPR
ncbi:MAG TPA: hypothetical protein VMT47_15125 [Polyangia bacterium]|nr:hypothetical protein [Polyangia bacterium]